MVRVIALSLCLGLLGSGCVGVFEDGPAGPTGAPRTGRPGTDPLAPAATTAIPRLSRREVERALESVLGVSGAAERYLPEDPAIVVDPTTHAETEVFDTTTLTKTPSQVFVEGLEHLAFEVAREYVADTARVDAHAGCRPVGFDRPCLGQLTARLGLGLWRRPLDPSEVEDLVTRAAAFEPDGHYVAVRFVVMSLVQSPELVYRREIGTDVGGGVRRLDDYELVARLAFFLWGTTPTPELLDAAAGGIDDATLASLARAMVEDPRASEQILTFHRLWLRYDDNVVIDPDLAPDMLAESEALLDRVLVSEREPWSRLFDASETFVTPRLADHYGLPTPTTTAWVSYDDAERGGILSHGAVLAYGASRGGDTRVSARGAMIARRLLCQTITPPPDVNVDAGVEVPPDACKPEAYAAHRSGTCAGCHALIDPIGFGLERYDGLGRYRELEVVNPSCVIEGRGSVVGSDFSGPGQLGATLVESGAVSQCGVQQLVRFAHRREIVPDDAPLLASLTTELRAPGEDFRALLVALVLDPSFRHRREAP